MSDIRPGEAHERCCSVGGREGGIKRKDEIMET